MVASLPQMLVILDGFGYRNAITDNAVAHAHMPHFHYFLKHYPHVLLRASGTAVGLPQGMAGNSLVGHTTIGAGQIIPQPLTQLLSQIHDGSFMHHHLLIRRLQELRFTGKKLHLMGLLSDGGSHAHEDIAYALIRVAAAQEIKDIVVHAFLDGRDSPPRSAATYLERLDAVFDETKCGILGSLHGRSFAMDRDEHIRKSLQSFTVLTTQTTNITRTWQSVVAYWYEQGITDEFIPPIALQPHAYIQDGDALIFWNVRADRARELTLLFVESDHPQLAWLMTGSWYGGGSPRETLAPRPPQYDSMIDVLQQHTMTTCCIAESEKYAHISYFLSGHAEDSTPQSQQIIIPSRPIETLKQHPEMRAQEITKLTLCSLETTPCDVYFINYANADMLGHTGDFSAAVRGLAYLDQELGKLYQACVIQRNGTVYITADHGNAELMFNHALNQPHTNHTTSPVPFVEIRRDLYDKVYTLPLTELSDIAPYILTQLKIPIPPYMKKAFPTL